jgi:transcriptional regulator with XRE-family HTH domain
MKGIGPHLKKLRNESGVSLNEMARRTKLAKSTLSRIENEVVSPRFHHVVAITKALSLSDKQLLDIIK